MSFTLVLYLAGHAYVLDAGLSADDCAAALARPPALSLLVAVPDHPVVAVNASNGDSLNGGSLSCELEPMEE